MSLTEIASQAILLGLQSLYCIPSRRTKTYSCRSRGGGLSWSPSGHLEFCWSRERREAKPGVRPSLLGRSWRGWALRRAMCWRRTLDNCNIPGRQGQWAHLTLSMFTDSVEHMEQVCFISVKLKKKELFPDASYHLISNRVCPS